MSEEGEAKCGDNSFATLAANDDDPVLQALFLDCHVEVEDRTWPGMNKQGGIAKVKAINRTDRSVEVHFVVGNRKEKGVSLDYIVPAPQYDPQSSGGQHQHKQTILRDRNMLLGRCKRCGSLRTDCGSCDMEEERTRLTAYKNPTDVFTRRQSKDASHRNHHASSNAKYCDDFIFDESSSEEDLEEWIRQNQKKIQLLKRERRRLEKEQEEYLEEQEMERARAAGETDKAQKLAKHNTKNNTKRSTHAPAVDTSKWESDDEYDLPLNALKDKDINSLPRDGPTIKKKPYTTRKKPKKLGNRRRKVGNEDVGDTLESVLESLPTPKRSTTRSTEEDLTAPFMGGDEASVRSSTCTDDEGCDTSSRQRYVDENIANMEGNADDNMSSCLTMDFMDDQGHFRMDSPGSTVESQASGVVTNPQYYDDYPEDFACDHISDFLDDDNLKEFIQPEGQEVAEHLPQDTKDRAADVTYTELPNFFDTEVARLELELLPDAKLKVAKLEREIKEWESQGASAPEGKELLQSCDSTLKELHVNLIRDGTDQCSSAIKRLQILEKKRYQKEEGQKPSRTERNERDRKTFARELKEDSLNRQVEEVIKKLRKARETLQASNSDDEAFSDQHLSCRNSGQSYSDNENASVESVSNCVDEGSRARGTTVHRPRRRQLSPWDRHKHAKRVRRPLSEAREARPSRKRRARDNEATTSGKKVSGFKDWSPTENASRRSRGEARHSLMKDRQRDDSAERTALQTHKRKRQHASHADNNNDTQEQGPLYQNQRRGRRHHGRRGSASTQKPRVESRIEPAQSSSEDEREVPSLDDLLDRNKFNQQNAKGLAPLYPHEKERRANSHSKRSIAGRMQAFLDSNAERQTKYVNENDDATIQRRNQWNGKSRRERQGLHGHNREIQHPLSRSDSFLATAEPWSRSGSHERESGQPNTTPGLPDTRQDQNVPFGEVTNHHQVPFSSIDSRHLIMRLTLRGKKAAGGSLATCHRDATVPTSVPDLSAMCEVMERLCPTSNQAEFIQNLEAMTSAFGRWHSDDTASRHTAAVLGFRTMLKLLQGSDLATTLQEIITRSGNLHFAYIAVISATLSLIEKGYSSLLTPDDGLVFNIFSACNDHLNGFVEAVTLQLVDSLYAVFHPAAWAPFRSGSDTSAATLTALMPLRDALAAVVDLPGDTCHCITTRIDSQIWRFAKIPEKHAFISSVDPDAWRKMLQSGGRLEKPKGMIRREPLSNQTIVRLMYFDYQILAFRFSRTDYHGVKLRRSGKFLLLRPTQSHAPQQPKSTLTRRSVSCRNSSFVVPSA
jgi:hypothetical protein